MEGIGPYPTSSNDLLEAIRTCPLEGRKALAARFNAAPPAIREELLARYQETFCALSWQLHATVERKYIIPPAYTFTAADMKHMQHVLNTAAQLAFPHKEKLRNRTALDGSSLPQTEIDFEGSMNNWLTCIRATPTPPYRTLRSFFNNASLPMREALFATYCNAIDVLRHAAGSEVAVPTPDRLPDPISDVFLVLMHVVTAATTSSEGRLHAISAEKAREVLDAVALAAELESWCKEPGQHSDEYRPTLAATILSCFCSRTPELNLAQRNLTTLPNAIGRFQWLKRLHIDHNNLKGLPASIGDLHNLRYLTLGYNLFRALPTEALARLPPTCLIVAEALTATALAQLPSSGPRCTREHLSNSYHRALAHLDCQAIHHLYPGAQEVMVYGFEACKYHDISSALRALHQMNPASSPFQCVFDCNVGTRAHRAADGTAIPMFPYGAGPIGTASYKMGLTNIVFENYRRMQTGKPLIPIVFAVEYDGPEADFTSPPADVVTSTRFTYHELRRALKMCDPTELLLPGEEVPPPELLAFAEAARRSFCFVRVRYDFARSKVVLEPCPSPLDNPELQRRWAALHRRPLSLRPDALWRKGVRAALNQHL